MYNTDIPNKTELPSNAQLIKATLAALGVAIILLVTCILPAEYAIDPTGIGKRLGLLEMGEIKAQLEQEAEQDAKPAESTALTSAPVQEVTPSAVTDNAVTENELTESTEAKTAVTETQSELNAERPTTELKTAKVKVPPSAERQVQLKPGEAAELKLGMKKDAVVEFKWRVNQGHVNFDTHGDNPKTRYHGYDKGKAVTSDQGSLTAAFEGKHGWFWRNRSKETVTIHLLVSGEFSSIERVL